MEIQAALASYASSLSVASVEAVKAGSTVASLPGYTLAASAAAPGSSNAAKAATGNSSSGRGAEVDMVWVNIGVGLVVCAVGLL